MDHTTQRSGFMSGDFLNGWRCDWRRFFRGRRRFLDGGIRRKALLAQQLSPPEGLSSSEISIACHLEPFPFLPWPFEHGLVVLFSIPASPSGFGIIDIEGLIYIALPLLRYSHQ